MMNVFTTANAAFVVLALGVIVLPHPVDAQCYSYDCSGCYSYDGCGWCASTQTCVPGSDQGPSSGSCAAWYYENCPQCTEEYSCLACLNQAGCGWCGYSQGTTNCLEGNGTRPYNPNYNCASWISGVPSNCPVPTPAPPLCSQWSGAGYCQSCINTIGCGWCDSTQTCIPGDHTGPSNNATCPSWFLTCPQCQYQQTCATCTATLYCGWCASTGSCFTGNASGNFRGTCSGTMWTTNGTTCPSPAPLSLPPAFSCSQYTSCTNCMQLTGCGWCAATQQCVPGTTPGPASGSCPTDVWYPAPSSVCPSCSSHSTCEGCRLDAGCGWCASTSYPNGCLQGNASGPFTNACPGRWTKYPTTCASCASLSTCSACTASNSGVCGWCGSTNRCSSGTSNGPTVGSCNDWIYYSDNCPVQAQPHHGADEADPRHRPETITAPLP